MGPTDDDLSSSDLAVAGERVGLGVDGPMTTVPKLWPGATVVCLATGASLTQADVDACRDRGFRAIAINNAYTVAPWADALYAGDQKWWQWHQGCPTFTGRKYTLEPQKIRWPGLEVLRRDGSHDPGLCLTPDGLRTGYNSGYQAINLAVHFGASRIVLLGYDMHGGHFFGKHPDDTAPPFHLCIPHFATLVEPLAALGVSVVNCTPGSAIPYFPRAPLASVLAEVAA